MTPGDPVQLGGVFVIAKDGGLLYQYVSREAGDHPDNADLRALDENAANRKRSWSAPSRYTWLRSISSAGYGERYT